MHLSSSHACRPHEHELQLLLTRCAPWLRRYIRDQTPLSLANRIASDDVLQAVRIAVMRACRKASFVMPRDAPAWFRRIARNEVRDRCRKADARKAGGAGRGAPRRARADLTAELIRLTCARRGPLAETTQREMQASVQAALRRLPLALRRMMALRVHNELPYEDIAVALDVSVRQVKRAVASCFAILRRDLAHFAPPRGRRAHSR
ncbi:MAG TPA: sigma-70 family RNA polymerase sigma factor [Phycisphaerae bacterium]|jgi:RNA polymerase sigma factor (sigma-70 family)